MDLVEHVAANIARHRLLRRKVRVVVAVSGGLDSMVLLHALHRLAAVHRWKLHVAHFNHGLRGRASGQDAAFVRRWAKRLALPCTIGKADVRKEARARGLSVEMAARDLRHAFLAEVAMKFRAHTVALAHHADDQVELFFLRLLRGSGSEGLGGMRWKSPSPSRPSVALIRPLLDMPKETLANGARDAGLAYREDASNASMEFQRNRVRRELLPLLETNYQPALRQVILRQMELLRAESDLVAELARDCESNAHAREFERWPVAVQRKHLQTQLRELGAAAQFEQIEALRNEANVSFTLPGGRIVLRNQHGRLQEQSPAKAGFRGECVSVNLRQGKKQIRFGGLRIQWAERRKAGSKMTRRTEGWETFDADKVGREIVLRHWREGDRFQPIGMRRPVKLQDWFINQKIPRDKRRSLVVAATACDEIWWVEGLRIGERFKVTSATKRLLEWEWQGNRGRL